MPILLQLSDAESKRSPKILYVSHESCITAYFFSNSSNLDAKTIRQKLKENTFKLTPSACLIQIGELLTTDRNWLSHVEVNSRYQKMGIGTQLIQLAIKHLHLNYIACVKENQAYNCCLTEAGEQLIISCIKKGLIKSSMCIFEGDANLFSSSADNDPGQHSFAIAHALSIARPPAAAKKRKLTTSAATLQAQYATQYRHNLDIDLFSNSFSPIRPYLCVFEKKPQKLATIGLTDDFIDASQATQNLESNTSRYCT